MGRPSHIEGVLARDLYIALNRQAKESNLTFHLRSVQQFAQRFANDLDTIQQAGFQITVNRTERAGHATSTYDLAYLL